MAIRAVATCLAAVIVLIAWSAQAQNAKTIFEKHKLLGFWAWDCSKPASPNNIYFAIRTIADNKVQIDEMNGPKNRPHVQVVDNATASKTGEVTFSGTRSGTSGDDMPFTIVWRVEPKKVERLEFSVGNKKLHTAGRYTYIKNRAVRAIVRCGA